LEQPLIRRAALPDWPGVAALLVAADLPLDGAEEHLGDFVLAADSEGNLLGCAALERYGHAGLLRSVTVAPPARGQGLGGSLVQHLLDTADAQGLDPVALLTTTAADYFPRFGFRVVPRSEVPDAVQASIEFAQACPTSAVALLRSGGSAARLGQNAAHALPVRRFDTRLATLADAGAIARIYNQGIEDRVATFETLLRSEEDTTSFMKGT
jgi:amino-acid N-acetyltransferase